MYRMYAMKTLHSFNGADGVGFLWGDDGVKCLRDQARLRHFSASLGAYVMVPGTRTEQGSTYTVVPQ